MSIILESLEKKFKRADSGDEETLNQYPYNVDFSGADLESCGVLTKPLTKCAIHILLFRKNKELCILFTIRSRNLKNFPGEICFPGGKFDITADKSLLETAESVNAFLKLKKNTSLFLLQFIYFYLNLYC